VALETALNQKRPDLLFEELDVCGGRGGSFVAAGSACRGTNSQENQQSASLEETDANPSHHAPLHFQ
jgi:hypothetical protein